MVRRVVFDSPETKTLAEPPQSLAYRAAKFQRQVTESSILFEVKSVRAMWDPNLADGNGGWRCPPGTRYAGRWTDKFGRNCGVGVARRIGNALRNVAGDAGDGKNDRREARARAASARARVLEERAVAAEQQAGRAVRQPAKLDKPDSPKPVQRVAKPNARIERRRKPQQEGRDLGLRPMTQEQIAEVRRLEAENARVEKENAAQGIRPEPKPRVAANRIKPRGEASRRADGKPAPKPADNVRDGAENLPKNAEAGKQRARRLAEDMGVDFGDDKKPAAKPKPGLVRARPKREGSKPGANLPPRRVGGRNEAERKQPPPPKKINPDRVWARYGLSEMDLGKVQAMSDAELDARRRRIRRDAINAKNAEQMKVYQDIVNQIGAEQDRRAKVAREAEAQRIAAEEAVLRNMPPDKVPILRGPGGSPKVTSLRESDFTEDERQQIFQEQFDDLQRFTADRPDMNDVDAVNGRIAELTSMVTEADRNISDIEALLRDRKYVADNFESVRELQKKFFLAKYKKNALIYERDKMRVRGRELEKRRQAEVLFQQADNPQASLADRKAALSDAKAIVASRDQQQADSDAWNQTMADWENQIQATIDAREQEIYGPNDREGMLRVGGKQLADRQKRVDALVAEAQVADSDSSRAAVSEKLNAELADVRASREKLGNLVEDPAALQENNLRRYLDATAADLTKEIRKLSPGGAKLSIYDGVSPKTDKPAILGNINDGVAGREIVNPNIKNDKDAIDHIANGGSLDEVPNRFWFVAVSNNASNDKVDKNSKFRQVSKNGGIMGETYIYVARDDAGAATSYGYVFKADRDEAGVGEVLSQQLMVQHGFAVEGAGWDGRSPARGENFVVLPFVSNALGNPEKIGGRGADNFGPYIFQDAGIERQSFAPRLHSFLHNYMMGVSDRHSGNGFTVIADGVPLAIPIDQGWAGRARGTDFATYMREAHGYTMDPGLFNDAATRLRTEADEAYAQSVIDVYDSMIERAEKAVEGGVDAWLDRISPGGPASAAVRDRVDSLYDLYNTKLEALKLNRKANLSRLMSKPLYDKLVA